MFYAVIFFATIVLLFLLSGVRKPAKFPPGNLKFSLHKILKL